MASDFARVRQAPHRRGLDSAPLPDVRAAGVELAAGGTVPEARDLALDGGLLDSLRRVRLRHPLDERIRIGVRGPIEDERARPLLHDPTKVHDRDPIADVTNHREVVADEKVAQALRALELGEQVQDLALDGDVETRGRLVGDDEAGSSARARATPTRRACPPESSWG